jgi:hypothetical protein
VLIAANGDALGIPRSDDWSYLLTLFRFLDHGRLGFNNWVSMTLVGQLALAAPVAVVSGNSITAVHVFDALLGYAGLVALVLCVPAPRRGGALLLAVTIGAGPLWAPLAPTFMTDIPAFAVQCMFLALAFAVLRAPTVSPSRYAVALAVGFVAIAIRQYEAIPVIAVAVVAIFRTARSGDRARLGAVLAWTAAATVATAALFAWWLSLPDSLSLAPSPVTSGVVANLAVRLGGFVRLTGLLLLPVIVLARPRRTTLEAWRTHPLLTMVVGAGTALWMAASYARVPEVPFVGNYVDRFGVLSRDVITGPRVDVMPSALFTLLAVAGSIAAVVLAVAGVPCLVTLGRRLRTRDLDGGDPVVGVLVLTLVGFTVAYGFAIATELPVFDRYALPVVPVVGLLLLGRRATGATEAPAASAGHRRAVLVGVGAALVVLGAVSLVLATDSAEYDAARWRLDETLVRRGYAVGDIYGGFEWISWHDRVGPPQGDTAAERQRLRARYLARFCVELVIEPGPGRAAAAVASTSVPGLAHATERIVAVPTGRPCRGAVSPGP